MAYTIDKSFALASKEGASQKASNKYLILHSTANLGASAKNNASYEKRTWTTAYVHFIAGDGIVYQVGTPGYVAWGAGPKVNGLSPVQIEMEESADVAKQRRIYNTYIELARDYAKKYGIPLTLDTTGNGVKTHNWVSQNLGGTDHSDPYGALKRIGIDKTQLAKDIANGAGSSVATKPATTTSSKPAVSKPAATPSTGIKWIAQTGVFTITDSDGIKLRSGSASVKSPLLAILKKGNTVKYNAYGYAGGYVWIRQPRSNGYGYLPTGNASGNKRTSYWGAFK
ncbi:N-acetylmuramoyl-L-alanine amidase [Paucilactobacillus hokkaidonensis JCM 18461]|uniref:N-acetylmuramoyl-L-alanine amidase n=2 Tax=Paucilactobacillus hokkaidonensis TaxID=1193095 RepID=A0A0A1GYI8_9LACO|nr:N-acetylmuramoyl-L-alanine amidase [Paucilactobacillus hokkaidonensis]KRO09792.1 N-acetylmuramoyl-L-alanine amidase [Paucilactobacillus hokkaidonensis]BAP85541.1 N-acetylmuramoyl-L-alanine amidase [Paucilactobacillus hokkaidonensis JCM 18461]